MQFRVIVVTDPPTHKHTHPPTNKQTDRSTIRWAAASLARIVNMAHHSFKSSTRYQLTDDHLSVSRLSATCIKPDISKLVADMQLTSSVTLTLTVRNFFQELRFERCNFVIVFCVLLMQRPPYLCL